MATDSLIDRIQRRSDLAANESAKHKDEFSAGLCAGLREAIYEIRQHQPQGDVVERVSIAIEQEFHKWQTFMPSQLAKAAIEAYTMHTQSGDKLSVSAMGGAHDSSSARLKGEIAESSPNEATPPARPSDISDIELIKCALEFWAPKAQTDLIDDALLALDRIHSQLRTSKPDWKCKTCGSIEWDVDDRKCVKCRPEPVLSGNGVDIPLGYGDANLSAVVFIKPNGDRLEILAKEFYDAD